jgi:soluble P-type ATPase
VIQSAAGKRLETVVTSIQQYMQTVDIAYADGKTSVTLLLKGLKPYEIAQGDVIVKVSDQDM